MATRKKTAAKSVELSKAAAPVRCKFFLADDLRQEIDGKISVIGLYADDVIVVQMPLEARDPAEGNAIGIDGISILTSLTGLVGRQQCSFELRGPSGNALTRAAPTMLDFPAPGHLHNLISKFRPFSFHEWGKYKLVSEIGVHTFEYEFEIRRGKPVPS